MVKPLPPLNAIRAFEVASRHLNLSRAAEELGVTQGAISKQVIALEEFIGIQLFAREPSGLQLTAEGGNLKEAIAPAFTTLSDAFARYSRRPPGSNTIRISTVASFASNFLVPRLAKFTERLPGCELEFLTSIRLVDLAREEFDIAVRYGPGDWDGVVATPLSDGLLIPVCAPMAISPRCSPATAASSPRHGMSGARGPMPRAYPCPPSRPLSRWKSSPSPSPAR